MALCKAARASFEAEVQARNEREEAAEEKLEMLARDLERKVDSEIATRHQQVAGLRKEVESLLR